MLLSAAGLASAGALVLLARRKRRAAAGQP
jgi:LPXTG-motif cell wall-anchored protein